MVMYGGGGGGGGGGKDVLRPPHAKTSLACLPITLMRNRGQEKESMGGAIGFAEVELKLSTNAARCEGLSYLLSLENIYIKY